MVHLIEKYPDLVMLVKAWPDLTDRTREQIIFLIKGIKNNG